MENDVLDRYDLDNNTLFIREENILQLAHSLHYLQCCGFVPALLWRTPQSLGGMAMLRDLGDFIPMTSWQFR